MPRVTTAERTGVTVHGGDAERRKEYRISNKEFRTAEVKKTSEYYIPGALCGSFLIKFLMKTLQYLKNFKLTKENRLPLLLPAMDGGNRGLIDAAFASAGCTPDVRLEVDSNEEQTAFIVSLPIRGPDTQTA